MRISSRRRWRGLPARLVLAGAIAGSGALAGTACTRAEAGGFEADHVLEGRWRVDYDEPWFTGSLVYDLREEEDGLKGYLVEIGDDTGSMRVSEEPLVFELRTWDGTRGAARYSMEFEGVDYETECEVELLSTDRLRLRYSFYGEPGEETWTRVEGGDR